MSDPNPVAHASTASQPDGNSLASPPRRSKFDHKLVVFEVEGVVHQVYRNGFTKWSQSVFRDMFELPQGEGPCEGDTIDNPIKLVGCTNDEFESLVEVMYTCHLEGEYPSMSKEQWIGVLKLSRLWDMPQIAGLAIKQVTALNLSPYEQILLGKQYGVPAWLKDGYLVLASEPSKGTLEEILSLGSDTAIKILWTRNELCKSLFSTVVSSTGFCIMPQSVYCRFCQRTFHFASWPTHQKCPNCNRSYNSYPAEFYFSSTSSSSQSAWLMADSSSQKVLEIFSKELEAAELRNAGTPT